MKHILFSALFLMSLNSYAIDMSRTETYETSYKEDAEGNVMYIGGCSVHQDYESTKFIVTKTVVEYFEPRDFSPTGFRKQMKGVEKELITAATSQTGIDSLNDADDITVETIKSTVSKGLDLWRLNIGVGGGNGMFLVFNRSIVNGKPFYEIVSNVFDGDVEFCDSSVWISK